jgi:hypothetical protein
MPKRVIDGDSLWVSEKLTTVPEKYRVEYAWILPLAQANGTNIAKKNNLHRTPGRKPRVDAHAS